MANKADIKDWIIEALNSMGGEASLIRVAEHIWNNHESDLRASGDLFYTWQYDMRWAGQVLQDKDSKLKKNSRSWSLT